MGQDGILRADWQSAPGRADVVNGAVTSSAVTGKPQSAAAVGPYDEFAFTREMLDQRHDEMESGKERASTVRKLTRARWRRPTRDDSADRHERL